MKFSLDVKGEHIEFESTLTNDQAAEVCSKLDSMFARDLAAKYPRLSPKQIAWMHKLAVDSKTEKVSGVSFKKIMAMLHFARAAGLTWPSIRTDTLKISLGRQSDAFVKRNGAPVGKIKLDGEWVPFRGAKGVLDELLVVEANPVEAARMYGKRMGSCCFCGRVLETAESLTVGYGPICAAKYGLPWGEHVGHISVIDILTEGGENHGQEN